MTIERTASNGTAATATMSTLVVTDPDHTPIRRVPLADAVVTVGCAAGADGTAVVLPDQRIARRHLRLARDMAGLRVTNLDGRQRTFFIRGNQSVPLQANRSYAWEAGWQIAIHTAPTPLAPSSPFDQQSLIYRLSLEAGSGEVVLAPAAPPTPRKVPTQRISIAQEGAEVPLQLVPGVPQPITIWLANHGDELDELALSLLGAPVSWLQALPEPVKLAGQSRVPVVLQVRVPPGAQSQAGAYTVTLLAHSQKANLAETCETRVTWLVLPSAEAPAARAITDRLTITQQGGAAPLQLTPGVPQTVSIWLENHGDQLDELSLTIVGVPASWVQAPAERVPVGPGARELIRLQLLVPPGPQSKAGAYSVTLRARSQLLDPAETCETRVIWLVLPNAEAPLIQIAPSKQRGTAEAIYTITIQNRSNVETRFDLNVFDDEQALSFDMDDWRLMLPPGESAAFPLRVAPELPLIDSSHAYGFVVQATPLGQPPATKTAQFVHVAPPPGWVRPAVALLGGALLVTLLVLLATTLKSFAGLSPSADATTNTQNMAEMATKAAFAPSVYTVAASLNASAVATATVQLQQTATAFAPTSSARTATAAAEQGTQMAIATAERAVVQAALSLATQQAIDAQVQQAAAGLLAKTAAAAELAGQTATVLTNRTATAQLAVAGTAGALQTSTAVAAVEASAQAQQAATVQGAQAQQGATAQSITQTALAPDSTVPDHLVFDGHIPSGSPAAGTAFSLTWKIVNQAGRKIDDSNWIVQLFVEPSKSGAKNNLTISAGDTIVDAANGQVMFTGIRLSGSGKNATYRFRAVLVGTKIRGYSSAFAWP